MASIYMTERIKPVKYRTRLKELREAKGLERKDIVGKSYALGYPITYQTVMAWENNDLSRIDPNTSYPLRIILSCSLGELVYEVDDEPIDLEDDSNQV